MEVIQDDNTGKDRRPPLRMFNVNIVQYCIMHFNFVFEIKWKVYFWSQCYGYADLMWLLFPYCFILRSITFKWSYPIQAYFLSFCWNVFVDVFKQKKIRESTIVKSYLMAEKIIKNMQY